MTTPHLRKVQRTCIAQRCRTGPSKGPQLCRGKGTPEKASFGKKLGQETSGPGDFEGAIDDSPEESSLGLLSQQLCRKVGRRCDWKRSFYCF
jgi:hypothetical protein